MPTMVSFRNHVYDWFIKDVTAGGVVLPQMRLCTGFVFYLPPHYLNVIRVSFDCFTFIQ